MTIRELYQWAEENDALDLEIEVQYRDGAAYYFGRAAPNPRVSEREEDEQVERIVSI